MPGSVFLDTNVLIYAIETRGPEPQKSGAAVALLRRSDICLSTQVLGEFYRAVTSPRREQPLKHTEAVAWVQLWKRYDVRAITVPQVDFALELAGNHKLNYFDALILAAARFADCEIVYSEDMNPGQDYNGVMVENPFAETAD